MRRLSSLALVLLAAPLAAQNAQRPTCDTPEHRQFDFWIGDWTVENPANGQFQGTNRIAREMNGCVLHERWAGSQGGNGESFNVYDRVRRVWHQTWVDDSGNLLTIEGALVDGRMVMQGEGSPLPNGRRSLNRITWSPMDGGRVRQHWETSADGGTTWQTSFLGVYRPRT